MTKKLRPVSLEEAESGIYIDFEGREKDPATFVGFLYQEGTEIVWKQVVFEETFKPIVNGYRSNSLHGEIPPRMGDFTRTFEEIRDLAESDNRCLFAYSEREITEIITRIPKKEIKWWEKNLLNVRKYAVEWKKKKHPDVVFKKVKFKGGVNSLDNFLKLIDFYVPPGLGPGNTAQRILHVRNMLNRWNGDVNKLTNTAKSKWTKVLNHNWYDCIGTRQLMITIHKESTESF